jgi:hypothetical protein
MHHGFSVSVGGLMRSEPMVAFPIWKARQVDPDPNLCFVIMPFGRKHLDKAYRIAVVPAAEDLGLQALRADHGPEEIMEGIWIRMLRARVIVADVTDENPNVMYELGIAHALGKPILLLSAGSDRGITFDLRRYRHIFYKTSPGGLEALGQSLRRELGTLLAQSPSGSQLRDELNAYAHEWAQRNHDSFSLHPEVVDRVRNHVPAGNLSALEIAYCTATGSHYGSVDHMVFWGRHCARHPAGCSELAMMVLPGKPRRPAVRTARLIEQFPTETRGFALERLIEHGANSGLVEAIREKMVIRFLQEHGDELTLLPEEIRTLLQQLPNINLAT